eukprot:12933673-Ditylum_brightwellii.AAC.1
MIPPLGGGGPGFEFRIGLILQLSPQSLNSTQRNAVQQNATHKRRAFLSSVFQQVNVLTTCAMMIWQRTQERKALPLYPNPTQPNQNRPRVPLLEGSEARAQRSTN